MKKIINVINKILALGISGLFTRTSFATGGLPFFKLMPNALRPLPLLLCLMPIFANFAIADDKVEKPIKLAVIGSEAELAKELDLLTVEFSKDKDYSTLSRSEWTKLIREYEILKKDTASAYSKFGNISGADALVVLDKQNFKKQDYLVCKLVSTKSGLILDALALKYPVVSKEMDWIGGIKKHFGRKLAKLASGSNGIKTVSLLNLRAETSSPELLELEKQLNAVFAYRLKSNENILVTERENMPEVLFEKYLNKGDESEFKTGSAVVDGSFNANGDNVEVSLRIKGPDGKTQNFKISGSKNRISEICRKLEEKLILSIGNGKHIKQTVEMGKEAEEYLKEAGWAYNCGLYGVAAKAAESAWALGNRDEKVMILRILSYAKIALSGSGKSTVEDDEINSAIISMELLKRHFITPFAEGKQMPEMYYLDINNWGDLSLTAIHSASELLRRYYINGDLSSNRAKLFYLRKLIRDSVDIILKKSEYSPQVWGLAVSFIPFWHENYHDTKKAYEEILLTSLKGAGTGLASNVREAIANKQIYFVDWNEKITRKRHDDMVIKFADDLCHAKSPQLQADGLWLKSENSYWMPNVDEKKISQQLNELVSSKKPEIYQGKLWFCRRLFETVITDEGIKEFLGYYPDYLIENPNAKQGPNIHKMIVRSAIMYKYKKDEITKLYNKIRNWEKEGNHQQQLKPSQYGPAKMNNFAYLKEFIYFKCPELKKNSRDSVIITDYWLPRKDMTPSSVGNYAQIHGTVVFQEGIYCLLYKNHADKVDKFYVYIRNQDLSPRKRIEVPYPWDSGNLFVNEQYFGIAASKSEFIIYDRIKEKFEKIKLQDYCVDRIVIQGETIYACYSVYGNQSKIESGILKMDMKGKNIKLLASSRRNPGKTPLDNIAPPDFHIFRNLNGNTVFISIGDGKEYVLQNDKIFPLSSMDEGFFNKYLNRIYRIQNTRRKDIAIWKTSNNEFFCSQPVELSTDKLNIPVIDLPFSNIDYRNVEADKEKFIVAQPEEYRFIYCGKLKGKLQNVKVPYDMGVLHAKLQSANPAGVSTLKPVSFAGKNFIFASNIAIVAADIEHIEKVAEEEVGDRH